MALQAHIENGYGKILKNTLGDECDIYVIGGSTIVWPIFAILCANIIDEYEYVIICYGSNDTYEIGHMISYFSVHISYLAYIAKMFQNSRSTPVILFSAYLNYPFQDKYNSYARGICYLFNMPFIDLHKDFEYIDPSTCVFDGAHYRLDLMEYIADKIMFIISQPGVKLNNIPIEINFELLIPKGLKKEKIPYVDRGDAIDPTFYIFSFNDTYKIPDDKYLCGIFYRIGDGAPYLIYKNNCITISKNLDFLGLNHVDYCYSLGSSIFNGLKGGNVGVSLNRDNTIHDPSLYAFKTIFENTSPLFVHSFLISDLPPAKYGYKIFEYYRNVFQSAEYDLYKILLRKSEFKIPQFWSRLEKLIPGSRGIFNPVLNHRPDLVNLFSDDDDYRPEKFLLWAWKYGKQEIELIKKYEKDLEFAINKLWDIKYQGNLESYPLLLYIIWLSRPDLAHMNPETEEGLQALKSWFITHGQEEYFLNSCNL